ncbi:hypothetical protein B7755_031855 [Streptomyces sp. NBS 14/10]|uniref:hypothetical protein n=1 Tax=Streptomyces sp. NBS 14/10 TaxID=1945643 RepID=UPI000B7F1526|nr:hypothetical protein [Streptomyces sp. NBS 14/10]KAK1186547.1 hypothetical protein B7755_031855 [Streptomyces sp. NBS 14/10]
MLSNRLAQRAGSAVTVGVAAYILSLPDGASIRIDTLCAHFKEGRGRISAAARLVLSERETAALAPDVAQWLDHGVGPYEIAETLTAGLPARITRRPARPLPGLPDVGGGLRATRRLTFA